MKREKIVEKLIKILMYIERVGITAVLISPLVLSSIFILVLIKNLGASFIVSIIGFVFNVIFIFGIVMLIPTIWNISRSLSKLSIANRATDKIKDMIEEQR